MNNMMMLDDISYIPYRDQGTYKYYLELAFRSTFVKVSQNGIIKKK